MKPFNDMTTDDKIRNQKRLIESDVEDLSNEEIMANDIEILTDNMYQKYFIEPVTIHEEDFGKRTIKQEKVRKFTDPFYGGNSCRECIYVDGVLAEFHFPFDGDEELFRCRTTVYSFKPYPQFEIINGDVVIKVEKTIDEVKHIGKDKLNSSILTSINDIRQGIECVNKDICEFNSELKLFAWKLLNEKREKVETFFEFAKKLEIPVEKDEYAQKHIPLQRRIEPIAHKYDRESYYCITDAEYSDILDTIRHTATTYERTPSSYKSMQEEALRNTLLASLNATYKGRATGETFRNHGKTDICIEGENRAAFVAECKIWTGQKEIKSALYQLDSYLTWRDCKTALVYFVRRKTFPEVLDKARDALKAIEEIKNVTDITPAEFECLFRSKTNVGQQVKIRVMLFNLYCEK